MNVRNTLIWTIIYISLIYRNNVVKCSHSPGPPENTASGASSVQNSPNLRKVDGSSDSIASVHSTRDGTFSLDSDSNDNANSNNNNGNNNTNNNNDKAAITDNTNNNNGTENYDSYVIIESDDPDNGSGCTCKNFWCGLLTCGVYNCCQNRRSKVKNPLTIVYPPNPGKRRGIELNITSKKSTHQFDYKKSRKAITFTAKQGYGFSSILTQESCCCSGCCGSGCCVSGCCGSRCCTTDVKIWSTTNEKELALEVIVYRKCRKLKSMEINKANGTSQTLCLDSEISY